MWDLRRQEQLGYLGALQAQREAAQAADVGKVVSTLPKPLAVFRKLVLGRFQTIIHAWRRFFNPLNMQKLDWPEMQACFTKLNYLGNYKVLFNYLDTDGDGFVTLGNLDEGTEEKVTEARKALLKKFESFKDLWQACGHAPDALIDLQTFVVSFRKAGVPASQEAMEDYFTVIDWHLRGSVSLSDLELLEPIPRERRLQLLRSQSAGAPQFIPRRAAACTPGSRVRRRGTPQAGRGTPARKERPVWDTRHHAKGDSVTDLLWKVTNVEQTTQAFNEQVQAKWREFLNPTKLQATTAPKDDFDAWAAGG
mmetsp:Transcript_20869/g.53017  ORF Transcript_20869/g.53017 Transcript_20869/m.53017 type:complete len:308 (-) Transcript_20869:93-1016(-)